MPYDVLVEPSGSLLVATGGKGKIYRLSGNPTLTTLVTRADAQQVTTFAQDQQGRLLLATSNPGRILRVTATTGGEGHVPLRREGHGDRRDVGRDSLARGDAQRHGGRALHAQREHAGAGQDVERLVEGLHQRAAASSIESPKARYLQWQAVLTGQRHGRAAPDFGDRGVPAAQHAAVVESITVHPPGVVFQRPFPTGDPELAGFDANTRRRPSAGLRAGSSLSPGPPLGRRAFQKSLQTFVWQARDADGDRLQFDVFYRLEGETTWKVLKRGLSMRSTPGTRRRCPTAPTS